jgi:hypothetical protein
MICDVNKICGEEGGLTVGYGVRRSSCIGWGFRLMQGVTTYLDSMTISWLWFRPLFWRCSFSSLSPKRYA